MKKADTEMRAEYERSDFAKLERGKFFKEASKGTAVALIYPYNVCMRFEWDSSKAAANLRKHQVSFKEAKTVFFDDFAVQFFDEEHSSSEERFIMLGMSSNAKLLVVCHCERAEGEVIRVISARKATRGEAAF